MSFVSEAKRFIHSFNLPFLWVYVVLIDTLYWFLLVQGIVLFTSFLQGRVSSLMNGNTAEQLQQALTGLPPDQLVSFASGLRALAVYLIGGGILLLAAAFLLFSLSRAFMWNIISDKEFRWKDFWKWNGLLFLLLLVFFIFSFGFVFVRWVLGMIFSNPAFYPFIHFIVLSVFTVAFLFFLFLCCFAFVRSSRVFSSFHTVFRLLSENFGRIFWSYLFALVTFVALQLAQIPFQSTFFVYPSLSLYVAFGVLFLYAGWLRFYISSSPKELV